MQVESVIQKLDRQIYSEIERQDTDVKILVQHMRERRREVAQEVKEKNIKNEILLKDLSSASMSGKVLEKTLCRRFTALN